HEPARGGGAGRALLTRLFTALEGRGVPGVHLGVASANDGAVAFYRRRGGTVVEERPERLVLARRLAPASEVAARAPLPCLGGPRSPRRTSRGRCGCSRRRSPSTSRGCPRCGSRARSSSSTAGRAPGWPSSPCATRTSTCR